MTLELHLGVPEEELNLSGGRGSNEAYGLKSVEGWAYGGGDNSTGMAIKPAGILDISQPYDFAGEASFMWSSSQSSQSENAWYRYVLGENSMIGREDANKEAFLSIRCIKDIE